MDPLLTGMLSCVGIFISLFLRCCFVEGKNNNLANIYKQQLKENEAVLQYYAGAKPGDKYSKAKEGRRLERRLRHLRPGIDKLHVIRYYTPFWPCPGWEKEKPGVMVYPTDTSMVVSLTDQEGSRRHVDDIAGDIMHAMDKYAEDHGVVRTKYFAGEIWQPVHVCQSKHSGETTLEYQPDDTDDVELMA
jgi:hypothetical protein